jgi:catechol 2,3-dioxygenase-like lactoylglutathione lyase family enzyme
MSTDRLAKQSAIDAVKAWAVPMNLELLVIPVSDVDRAKTFYSSLGWRLDMDFTADDGKYRVVQFTPIGSPCSIMFGRNISEAAPGSVRGLHLIVADIDTARDELLVRGIEVGEPFHDAGGIFHHANGDALASGPNPQRKSYASYASFSDPDGNQWVFQEVTARLTGDLEVGDTRFTNELVTALRDP